MWQRARDAVEDVEGDFARALAAWRGLAHPCAPPIGVGEFDVLYASAREVVVWYSPVREGQHAGEIAIPCARLAAAWAALAGGAALDEAALTELGASIAGGRWLLALLALLPGARVQAEPLALSWSARAAAKARTTTAKRAAAERPTRMPRQPRQPAKQRAPATPAGRTSARSARQPQSATRIRRRPGA